MKQKKLSFTPTHYFIICAICGVLCGTGSRPLPVYRDSSWECPV